MKKEIAIVYHPKYNLDLGPHVFPAKKYEAIHALIQKDPSFKKVSFHVPIPADQIDLELVHGFEYLNDVFSYEHTFRTNTSELPLHEAIISSFLFAVGGTILATKLTNQFARVMNVGGGFHHSFPSRAEGFCYFNDVAIATKIYLEEHPKANVLIIDLDLHQGNGTAYIFEGEKNVYTFSMHQENLYPKKEKGNLDVGLEMGIPTEEYLSILERSLEQIRKEFQPDLIFYLAGADPYEDDSLGSLKVSMAGLKERDRMVYKFGSKIKVPVVTVLAGGYANNFQDTVQIHFNTLKAMMEF